MTGPGSTRRARTSPSPSARRPRRRPPSRCFAAAKTTRWCARRSPASSQPLPPSRARLSRRWPVAASPAPGSAPSSTWSLEVEVDVAESFISRVAPGMPASVKLNAYPDWEIPAQVITVIPTADRSKATVTVRVGFKVKDPRIVPEMGAHVAFLSPAPTKNATAAPPRTVIVPPDAVQTEDGGQAVLFVITNGRAERRAVRLGDRNAQGQIVIAGIAPGEAVAVEGADKLKDGAGVKVVK